MYGTGDGPDTYMIKPWFVNPYDPLRNVYWLICPSHQVCLVKLCDGFIFHILVEEYDQRPVLVPRWRNKAFYR